MPNLLGINGIHCVPLYQGAMSESQSTTRVDELSDIFVSVTGDDSVTEAQEEVHSDRELPADEAVDVDDGLEDAVAGAETGSTSDPAA